MNSAPARRPAKFLMPQRHLGDRLGFDAESGQVVLFDSRMLVFHGNSFESLVIAKFGHMLAERHDDCGFAATLTEQNQEGSCEKNQPRR